MTASQRNYELRFRHYRLPGNGAAWPPDPRGGLTVCRAEDKETGEVTFGIAICHPTDNFCYERGRTISAGRAMGHEKHMERRGPPDRSRSSSNMHYFVLRRLFPEHLIESLLDGVAPVRDLRDEIHTPFEVFSWR